MAPASPVEQIAFLESLGTADVAHSGGDFLHHLRAVHDLLRAHGAPEHIAAAGLFHSIYGTERFQDFTLPLDQRPKVRALIGDQAERLAWLNCVMDRASFDKAVAQALAGAESVAINDREGVQIPVSAEEIRDLAQVHLFDWLEQVERSEFGWDYRRQTYEQMAALIGDSTQALYNEVFAREPASQT